MWCIHGIEYSWLNLYSFLLNNKLIVSAIFHIRWYFLFFTLNISFYWEKLGERDHQHPTSCSKTKIKLRCKNIIMIWKIVMVIFWLKFFHVKFESKKPICNKEHNLFLIGRIGRLWKRKLGFYPISVGDEPVEKKNIGNEPDRPNSVRTTVPTADS